MGSDQKHPDHTLPSLPPKLRRKLQELEEAPLLPDWPDQNRGVPNLCLRSALFGVIRRGRRRAVKGEQVAAVKGLAIRYTGWRLDQGDFDVLAHALHLTGRHRKGDSAAKNFVRFKVKGFLKAIGRQAGKSGREWLKDSLRRLTATAVEISMDTHHPYDVTETLSYAGSLVEEFYYNDREQTYFLRINPKLATLFDAGWTRLEWRQRLLLKTDLAKWLHGFYASHRTPYPVKVATLHHLCGSESRRLVDFRRNLRVAMEELVAAGAVATWRISQEDKVHVDRHHNRQQTPIDQGK